MAKPRALILEDNKGYTTLLNKVIRDLGFRVDHAKSRAESDPLVNDRDYALAIISSSVGDGKDGAICISAIKERDKSLKRNETPILVVSATEGPQITQRALADGAHGCLAKNGITHEKIKNAIKGVISEVNPQQLPEALKFIYR